MTDDRYTIQGCIEEPEKDGVIVVKAVLDDNAAFWGIYRRDDDGCSMWVADRLTRELAEKYIAVRSEIAPILSEEYWDCECREKFIQHNSVVWCRICGAHREEMPDSRQSEVDEGIYFAE